MSTDTVVVTGGSGKIGGAVLEEFAACGYHTVNVDRRPGDGTADEYLEADVLDAGEVYGVIAKTEADSLVHMGTINAPVNHPGHVTYESNLISSYNVLEASASLGLEAVCLASSINAMGSVYQDAPMDVRYLPVDEAHPLTPRDPYSMAKHALEVTADGFGRLDEAPRTISSLRFPWVATSEELRETIADTVRDLEGLRSDESHTTRDVLFSYVHLDDAARLVRKAIEASFRGHEVFWAVAGDTTADVPSATLASEFYPDADARGELSNTDSLINISKANDLLNWTPERSWRTLND